MSPLEPATAGLRERKKAKTRSLIQQHALRLFRDQGYAATTVDQIAEAAEVSPSTFFRYFPAKEDVVLYDDYDPLLFAALRNQPAEYSPVKAVRMAMREVFEAMPPEQLALEVQRGQLMASVLEVRGRMLAALSGTVQTLAAELAQRVGRSPDDFAVRNLAGAMMGISLSVMLTAIETPDVNYIALIDAGLEHLERGLPL